MMWCHAALQSPVLFVLIYAVCSKAILSNHVDFTVVKDVVTPAADSTDFHTGREGCGTRIHADST